RFTGTAGWRVRMGSAGGPEFPAQAGDNQQHKQAEQPATGIAGGGLHGVINHWARELLLWEAER
ncbi:hypothetical protein, partial [Gelidibacter salicanalis]|uniref:hypothetical protein n=1 Tax=Gelidibacter salicanalis TaxID=291193 RepID=UPI001F3F3A68